jgi:hypothetical protein
MESEGSDEAMELEMLSKSDERKKPLLGKRTMSDFRRILHDRISDFRIRLETVRWSIGLRIMLKVEVDGNGLHRLEYCPCSLLQSLIEERGTHGILTCTCGMPECAGIDRHVIVVHEEGRTLWKAYHTMGRKVFLFETRQYREEILGKVREAMELADSEKDAGVRNFDGPGGRSFLAELYERATNTPVFPERCESALPMNGTHNGTP